MTEQHCSNEVDCMAYPSYCEENEQPCPLVKCENRNKARSRPHTQPPAPETRCCETCKNIPCKPLNRIPCVHHPENPCIENGCTDIENCDEICEYSRIFSPAWVKQHDATIRNETLEPIIETLSDLNRYSCQEYDEAILSDNEREMGIHLEYGNRLWGIIRSLRREGEL